MTVTQIGPYHWRVTTDEKHVITVDSHLISAEWSKSAAFIGQDAYFTIETAFVGYETPATVVCKSEQGVELGEQKVPIRMNRGRGSFRIPDTVSPGDRVYFTVKFDFNVITASPDIGTSTSIPVFPEPYVVDMKWGQNKILPEEIVDLTASFENVRDHTPVFLTVYRALGHGLFTNITTLNATVQNDKVGVRWVAGWDLKKKKIVTKEKAKKLSIPHSNPTYIFAVTLGDREYGRDEEISGRLEIVRNPIYHYSI